MEILKNCYGVLKHPLTRNQHIFFSFQHFLFYVSAYYVVYEVPFFILLSDPPTAWSFSHYCLDTHNKKRRKNKQSWVCFRHLTIFISLVSGVWNLVLIEFTYTLMRSSDLYIPITGQNIMLSNKTHIFLKEQRKPW